MSQNSNGETKERSLSDFPYADTLNEVLLIAIDHLESVRNEGTLTMQGVHLKMASMAMRCAINIYADQLNKEVKPQ